MQNCASAAGAFAFRIDGPEGPLDSQLNGACNSCSDVVAQGCESPCVGDGVGFTARIDPGGTFEAIWSRHLWQTITLECEGCDAQCNVASLAPDGTYVARVNVFSTCTPNQPEEPFVNGCDCMPGVDGSCEISLPSAMFGDEVELEAGFAGRGPSRWSSYSSRSASLE